MFHRQTLPVTVIVLVLLVSYSQAWVITLFEHKDHRGLSVDVHGVDGKCVNVPGGWNDHTSSINSNGRCFLLYEGANCSGRTVKISEPTRRGESGCPRHNDLRACFQSIFNYRARGGDWTTVSFSFNDALSSVRLC